MARSLCEGPDQASSTRRFVTRRASTGTNRSSRLTARRARS